jgi:hypothetical protein
LWKTICVLSCRLINHPMQHEGPILESLTRRLAETPEDFLAEPRVSRRGRVQTAAVVGDLIRLLGGEAGPEQLTGFVGRSAPPTLTSELPDYAEADPPALAEPRLERNRFAVTLILCWLLSDGWFRQIKPETGNVLRLLNAEAAQLAAQVAARKFVTEPDRREELARIALARLGFRPAGETLAQAQDRLTTLNTTERARVLQAARAAEERARQIREALVRKAAEESADKWTRE